jgi:hypothetical protein
MKPSRLIPLALLAAGCVHYGPELIPALGTAQVPGHELQAAVAENGVRAAVSGERWKGGPPDLGALVTPLRVTLSNQGSEPVRIQYRDFALVATGFRSSALSPFHIQRPGTMRVQPYYPWTGFYIAPRWSPFYPSIAPWGGGWDWGPYGDGFAEVSEPLPSHDMLSKALPEGVLQPGGTVSGYLYFQHVGPDIGSLQFQAVLISPNTEQRVAFLRLPFVVKG